MQESLTNDVAIDRVESLKYKVTKMLELELPNDNANLIGNSIIWEVFQSLNDVESVGSEFYYKYAELIKLTDTVILDIRNHLTQYPMPLDSYIENLEGLKEWLSLPGNLLQRQGSAKKVAEEQNWVKSIEMVEGMLKLPLKVEGHIQDEYTLSQVREFLLELFKNISKCEELDVDLKLYLDIHLAALIEAIQEFQSTGKFDALKAATDSAIMNLLKDPNLVKDENSFLKNAIQAYGFIAKMTGDFNNFQALFEKLAKNELVSELFDKGAGLAEKSQSMPALLGNVA